MIDRRQFIAVVVALGWLAGAAVAYADSYSREQIELAGRLGETVALSRICSGTVPTTAVVKALEASGLSEADVLGETVIRDRMQHQASAVMLSVSFRKDHGETQAEIVKSACDSFRASFGPNGLLLPEDAD